MKKISTLILFSAFALGAYAQSDGYYHIKNTVTERYMVMADNQYDFSAGTGTADVAAIITIKSLSEVNTHPGAVAYLKKVKGTEDQYDISAQGTSIGKGSNGKLYPHFTAVSGGYQIWGSYSGATEYLNDTPQDSGSETGKLTIKGTKARTWKLYPIGKGDHYIGIKPMVHTNDGYWATIYCSFPFKLGSGMTAYYVNKVNKGGFQLKKVTDNVIAATFPVLVKLAGSSASDNKITPMTSGGSEPSDNHLYGRYFDSSASKHVNRLAYNSRTMRVLGKDENGKLAFVVASASDLTDGAYIPHNKPYLEVSSGSAEIMTEDGYTGIESIEAEEKADNKIYTLAGQELPANVTPKAGIYIKNGKKIVIK